MTAAANGSGYWMVADDGGIFAFDVPFEGQPAPVCATCTATRTCRACGMRSLPSNDGYYILGLDGTVWAFGNGSSSGRRRAAGPSTSCKRPDDPGLPRALGPTAPAPAPGDAVEVRDDRVGIVAEGHERDADDGAGPAATAHAVHRDADSAFEMRDHVGRGCFDEGALPFRFGRVAAASRDPGVGRR